VVVDDQQTPGHATIVPPPRSAGMGAVPNRLRGPSVTFHQPEATTTVSLGSRNGRMGGVSQD
jgi:hypothetical protein